MELDITQKKIILSKPFGLSMVKGLRDTGKTTAAIYRILHLKNNYCLYDDDGILMVNCGQKDKAQVVDYFNKIESESKFDYISLFSSIRNNVWIKDLQDLINLYFNRFLEKNLNNVKILNEGHEKSEIIKECIDELSKIYNNSKLLKQEFLDFFDEEIGWIKACNFISIEQYQEADRIGRRCKKGKGPQRLLKDSKERQIIFDLFTLYNEKLNKLKLIDAEDKALIALGEARLKPEHLYTHIMIDECENLTRVEMELLRVLSSNKVYSSIMFFLNQNDSTSPNAWIIKGRKLNALGFEMNGRSFALKNIYTNVEVVNMEQDNDKIVTSKSFIENYTYLDLRHSRSFDFSRDGAKVTEFILKQEDTEEVLTEEELRDIPVYSDIAAGEPILMSSELESNFYLPQYWLKGLNDCFVLKVKGDSMIGANIEDGDLVVIRKQYNASNKDIVAVDIDGAATLKRLSIGKGTPLLLPENSKYSPIPLFGTEAKILGLAVGVIKDRNR